MPEFVSDIFSQISGWLNPNTIAAGGYVLITLVVCAETGIAIGVFFPGESLVLVAGMLAGAGELDIRILIPLLFTAAVVGDAIGFAFGNHLGPRLFTRQKSFFFRPEFLLRAQSFYDKYGAKTIVLARFVPVVRTFAPIIAGAARMQYRKFLLYNLLGGFLWVTSMLLTGYFLGALIPDLEHKMGYALVIVVLVSLLLPIYEFIKLRAYRRKLKKTDASAGPSDDDSLSGSDSK